MKIKSFITTILFVLLFSTALNAAQIRVKAGEAAAVKVDTKDAFLAFVLEKAQTYTDKAETAISKAVDVVTAETPQLVREFLIWRMWMHGIKGIFPLVLGVLFFVLFYKQYHNWGMDQHHAYFVKGNELNVVFTIVGGIGASTSALIFACHGISQLMNFVQILIAPRVYVVEQVIGLLK